MAAISIRADHQARPLEDYNVVTGDRALVEALNGEGGGRIAERAATFGARCGAASTIRAAELASRVSGDRGQAFGILPAAIDTRAIIERADPGSAGASIR